RGNVLFRATTIFSFRNYRLYEAGFRLPNLLHKRVSFEMGANHHYYPSLNYYGPGPDSHKTGRSNYLLEDTSFNAALLLRLTNYLSVGASGGYELINVGPGRDDRFISTDKIYTPATTPGIDHQSNFWRGGPFVRLDFRDNPRDPQRGGSYLARFDYYDDQKV